MPRKYKMENKKKSKTKNFDKPAIFKINKFILKSNLVQNILESIMSQCYVANIIFSTFL